MSATSRRQAQRVRTGPRTLLACSSCKEKKLRVRFGTTGPTTTIIDDLSSVMTESRHAGIVSVLRQVSCLRSLPRIIADQKQHVW